MSQRVLLSFVCALALILIPLPYSSLWGQSNSPATTQQDRTDQRDVNQKQANPDQNQTQSQDLKQNQGDQSSPNVNSSTQTRQKPASSENNPSTTQDQNEKQNRTDKNRTQNTTGSQTTTGSQNSDQNNSSNQNLPNTAGELPLLALIGLLSLGIAGTRVLARARSNRQRLPSRKFGDVRPEFSVSASPAK